MSILIPPVTDLVTLLRQSALVREFAKRVLQQNHRPRSTHLILVVLIGLLLLLLIYMSESGVQHVLGLWALTVVGCVEERTTISDISPRTIAIIAEDHVVLVGVLVVDGAGALQGGVTSIKAALVEALLRVKEL